MKAKNIVSLGGANVAYKVTGNGPAIVLVHGMGATKEIWVESGWVDLLKEYFTVIIIDVRGNGESDKSYDSSFYSINKIYADINVIVRACGFYEYNYFGHSYGATIGLQLSSIDKNIRKVICAGTIFGNEFFEKIVPTWIDENEKYLLMKINNVYDEEKLTERDIKWIKATDFELELAQLKAWRNWYKIEVSDVKSNLAMYSGSNDNPMIIENLLKNEEKMKKYGIELKIFKDLDHNDLINKVEIVSDWILNFLLTNKMK
jgi:pimeloyl-ACP methyl ester carboxylesterase